ncbi:MAG: hypothetical protein ABI647_01500 [Gemmatimonadota bacterium]
MRVTLAVLLAALSVTAQSAAAQRPQEARKGRERAREHAPPPAPARRPRPDVRPTGEHRPTGGNDDRPHVSRGRWYGHATPNDSRFRLARPFEHGRFVRLGPRYRYRVDRFDRALHRLWIPGGAYFEIASWDWDLISDWWDCSRDDFVVYDDPDHIGWYLLYYLPTGAYVHVQYLGR